MDIEKFKTDFKNANKSDKLRCFKFVEEEIQKLKAENPKNFSYMLSYIKDPEKVKDRIYKRRNKLRQEKNKDDVVVTNQIEFSPTE